MEDQRPTWERKTSLLSWQGLSQSKAMESLFTIALSFSFSPYKTVLFPLMCRNYYMSCHGGRSQITVICWFWISPSLMENICQCSFMSADVMCIECTVVFLAYCRISVHYYHHYLFVKSPRYSLHTSRVQLHSLEVMGPDEGGENREYCFLKWIEFCKCSLIELIFT